jgi:serine phosphatase RsbU (regulator of sigma subunit)
MNLEVSCLVRSSCDVGVVFLDSFYLSDRRLGIYLGDVVGKGLPAAMSAGLTIRALRSTHTTIALPAAVLETFHST